MPSPCNDSLPLHNQGTTWQKPCVQLTHANCCMADWAAGGTSDGWQRRHRTPASTGWELG